MSEQVARLAVNHLRKFMFPALPPDMQAVFPKTKDPLISGPASVQNIVVGQYLDFGANAANPLITVNCSGAAEGIVNVYRHLDLHVDIWVGGNLAINADGRRFVSIIYEYIFRTLQNTNWTGFAQSGGSKIRIQRCYETERSPIMFEAMNKVYHLAIVFRVEAISETWY